MKELPGHKSSSAHRLPTQAVLSLGDDDRETEATPPVAVALNNVGEDEPIAISSGFTVAFDGSVARDLIVLASLVPRYSTASKRNSSTSL